MDKYILKNVCDENKKRALNIIQLLQENPASYVEETDFQFIKLAFLDWFIKKNNIICIKKKMSKAEKVKLICNQINSKITKKESSSQTIEPDNKPKPSNAAGMHGIVEFNKEYVIKTANGTKKEKKRNEELLYYEWMISNSIKQLIYKIKSITHLVFAEKYDPTNHKLYIPRIGNGSTLANITCTIEDIKSLIYQLKPELLLLSDSTKFIHCDISKSNIVFEIKNGYKKFYLIDWGCAIKKPIKWNKYGTIPCGGTFIYSSVSTMQGIWNKHSDIISLYMLCIHLLTDYLPWENEPEQEQICNAKIEIITKLVNASLENNIDEHIKLWLLPNKSYDTETKNYLKELLNALNSYI